MSDPPKPNGEIRSRAFRIVSTGYDPDEVQTYLALVADQFAQVSVARAEADSRTLQALDRCEALSNTVDELLGKLASREREAAEAEQRAVEAERRLVLAEERGRRSDAPAEGWVPPPADRAPGAPPPSDTDEAGIQISRMLREAEGAANRIRAEGAREAEAMRASAERAAEESHRNAIEHTNRAARAVRNLIATMSAEADQTLAKAGVAADQLRAGALADAEAQRQAASAEAERIVSAARSHAALWEAAADELREHLLHELGHTGPPQEPPAAVSPGEEEGPTLRRAGDQVLPATVADRLVNYPDRIRDVASVLTAAVRDLISLAELCARVSGDRPADARDAGEVLLASVEWLMTLLAQLGQPALGLTERFLRVQESLREGGDATPLR